jgi:hypothetical protein
VARVKVTRKVTAVSYVDEGSYPGMSVEQAAQYERELDEGDQIEAVVFALQDGNATVETEAEIVE